MVLGRVIFLGGSIKVVLNNGFCIFKLSSFTKHRSTLGRSLHHTITWFENLSRGRNCPNFNSSKYIIWLVRKLLQENCIFSRTIRFWPKWTRFNQKKGGDWRLFQVYSRKIGYFSKTNHSSLIHYENLMTLFHHE